MLPPCPRSHPHSCGWLCLPKPTCPPLMTCQKTGLILPPCPKSHPQTCGCLSLPGSTPSQQAMWLLGRVTLTQGWKPLTVLGGGLSFGLPYRLHGRVVPTLLFCPRCHLHSCRYCLPRSTLPQMVTWARQILPTHLGHGDHLLGGRWLLLAKPLLHFYCDCRMHFACPVWTWEGLSFRPILSLMST